MMNFTLTKSRTAPPGLFGGIRPGMRRPLYGHLNTAFGGKRGGPLQKNIGPKARTHH